MRIVKSANGFSISATTTIRVTFGHIFFDREHAAVYECGPKHPTYIMTEDPRQLWRAAYRYARYAARYNK